MSNLKIIDLTQSLSPKNKELVPIKINYINHKKGANLLGLGVAWQVWAKNNIFMKLFSFICYLLSGKLIKAKCFPHGEGLSMEKVFAMSHCGTHIDAPSHYGSGLTTIDVAPLELFYDRPGVLLDFSNLSGGEVITGNAMKEVCRKLPYKIQPQDIVLIKSEASKYWSTDRYYIDFPSLTVEAVTFLLDQGVEVIGVDMFAVDLPQHLVAKKYAKTKNENDLWPVHLLGRKRPYYIIENLTNLNSISRNYGFKVTALPIKIENAGAAWARVIAIL